MNCRKFTLSTMNTYLLAAALLAFVIGLIHSVLGEILIFRRQRREGWIPTDGGQVFKEPHVRIQWANWHITTAMGWGMAAVLYWLAMHENLRPELVFIARAITASMLVSSGLVLVATKGKHPGWIGLLGVAVLAWMA